MLCRNHTQLLCWNHTRLFSSVVSMLHLVNVFTNFVLVLTFTSILCLFCVTRSNLDLLIWPLFYALYSYVRLHLLFHWRIVCTFPQGGNISVESWSRWYWWNFKVFIGVPGSCMRECSMVMDNGIQVILQLAAVTSVD